MRRIDRILILRFLCRRCQNKRMWEVGMWILERVWEGIDVEDLMIMPVFRYLSAAILAL